MALITEDLIATAGADTDIAGRTLTGGGTWATKLNTSTQVTNITNATPDYFVGSANSTSLYKTSVSAPDLNDEVILETEWTNFGQASTGPMLGISGTLAGSDRTWYGFYVGPASPYDYFINKYNQAGGIDLNVGVTQAAAGVSLTTGVTYEQNIRRIDNGDGTVTIKGYIDGVEVISWLDDGVTNGALLPPGSGGMRNRSGARSYSFVHQTWGAAGAMVGATSITITHSGTLAGAGVLAGSFTLALLPSSTLTGTGALVSGATLTFALSGTMAAPGAMAGTAALTLSQIGELSGSAAMGGSITFALTGSGTMTGGGAGAIIGNVVLGFNISGSLGGAISVPALSMASAPAIDAVAVSRATLRHVANVSSASNTVAVAYRPRGGTSWP